MGRQLCKNNTHTVSRSFLFKINLWIFMKILILNCLLHTCFFQFISHWLRHILLKEQNLGHTTERAEKDRCPGDMVLATDAVNSIDKEKNQSILEEIEVDRWLSSKIFIRILRYFITRANTLELFVVQGKLNWKSSKGRSPTWWFNLIRTPPHRICRLHKIGERPWGMVQSGSRSCGES